MILKQLLSVGVVLLATVLISAQSTAAGHETQVAGVTQTARKETSKQMLGLSVIGNQESPRVLTIVPWRQPLADGNIPEITPTWTPRMNLLDPDAFRRDINLFLHQRKQGKNLPGDGHENP